MEIQHEVLHTSQIVVEDKEVLGGDTPREEEKGVFSYAGNNLSIYCKTR